MYENKELIDKLKDLPIYNKTTNFCFSCNIGEGFSCGYDCVIYPNTIIGKNVTLGRGVIILDRVRIKDNVHIEDNAHIGVNSEIGGGCFIGENTKVPDGTRYMKGSRVMCGDEGIVLHLRDNKVMGCYYDSKRKTGAIWIMRDFYLEKDFDKIPDTYLPMFVVALKKYVKKIYKNRKEKYK